MFTISDNNTTETKTSWEDLVETAETWYDYLADDEDFPPAKIVHLHADYSEVPEGDIEALQAAIIDFENLLATRLGYSAFSGHGNCSCSAGSQAGFDLKVGVDEVTIIECDSELELFCHYDGQTNRQACYLELGCREKNLCATYDSEIGNAVPFSVYHGHDQRFGIALMKGSTADALMKEIKPLAQRVLDGYDEMLNDQSNWVATFTDDAQEAIDEIKEICDSAEGDLECWDCGDWLGEVTHESTDETEVTIDIDSQLTITADTTDGELNDFEEKIDAFALSEGIVLSGVDAYLKNLRDDCEPDLSLREIEMPIMNGNQITGYTYFYCYDPTDLSCDEYKDLGPVSETDLINNPDMVEEAYCGDGDSCREPDELIDLVKWLVEQNNYSIYAALQCAANLAKLAE